MKEHFKYKYGYINLDDNNLYLTNSGNWQETEKLSEKRAYKNKRPLHIGGNTLSVIKTLPIIYAVGSITIATQTAWYAAIIYWIILTALLFVASRFIDLSTPNRIKIPLHKINTIETLSGKTKVNFNNVAGQADFIFIEQPDERFNLFLPAKA